MEDMNKITIREKAIAYYDEANYKFKQRNMNDVITNIQEAIPLFKDIEDYEYYGKCMNLLGVAYGISGNDVMSIDCYLDGLTYSKTHNIRSLMAYFYNNIGSRFQELGAHTTALEYFLKSKKELEEGLEKHYINHERIVVINQINLAISLTLLQKYEEAEVYLSKLEPKIKTELVKPYELALIFLRSKIEIAKGNDTYARSHLNEMLHCVKTTDDLTDYNQYIKQIIMLCLDLCEYSYANQVICCYESFAEEQTSIYNKLLAVEFRIKYCKKMGLTKLYRKLCIEHMELYEMVAEQNNIEKIKVFETKIELKRNEEKRLKAEKINKDLTVKSVMDPLTGIYNRYHLEQELKTLIKEKSASNENMVVGIIDVDCFKEYNDNYGHISGDQCLISVVNEINQHVAHYGNLYRYGGDEFLLILHDDNVDTVKNIASNIKKGIAKLHILHKYSKVEDYVTLSQGYVIITPSDSDTNESIIKYADRALYSVKKNKKNGYRIIIENKDKNE